MQVQINADAKNNGELVILKNTFCININHIFHVTSPFFLHMSDMIERALTFQECQVQEAWRQNASPHHPGKTAALGHVKMHS